MKITEMEKGQFVEDTWFWDWGIGKVSKVLKTIVYINFSVVGKVVFDKSHCQFLKKIG